jgi:hypothetical protein
VSGVETWDADTEALVLWRAIGGEPIGDELDPQFALIRDRLLRARASAPDSAAAKWQCAARHQSTVGGNDPADCNWPLCSCDPYADKVIAALQECGSSALPAASPSALALATREELEAVEQALAIRIRERERSAVWRDEEAAHKHGTELLRRFVARIPVRDAGEAAP